MSDFHFQPVIIIGAARSGTNLVRDLLTHIPGVATWPCDEINYVWRHGNAGFPTDELRPSHVTPRIKRAIRDRFLMLAEKTGADWIVEKTCANSLRVDYVREIIPEAKFVFLVRNGLDVALSADKRWRAPLDFAYVLKKARQIPVQDIPRYAARYLTHRVRRLATREKRLPTWGPRFIGLDESVQRDTSLETCFLQWKVCVESASQALAAQPKARVHFLRYEALVAEPLLHLRALAAGLEIPFQESLLHELAAQVCEGRGGGVAKMAELQALEIVARSLLTRLQVEWQECDLSRDLQAA